jgi:hypothetical protein
MLRLTRDDRQCRGIMSDCHPERALRDEGSRWPRRGRFRIARAALSFLMKGRFAPAFRYRRTRQTRRLSEILRLRSQTHFAQDDSQCDRKLYMSSRGSRSIARRRGIAAKRCVVGLSSVTGDAHSGRGRPQPLQKELNRWSFSSGVAAGVLARSFERVGLKENYQTTEVLMRGGRVRETLGNLMGAGG